MIESGTPDRDERRVEAMMASIHRAVDYRPRDIALHEAIGAALGIDPDEPDLVPEEWLAAEVAASR